MATFFGDPFLKAIWVCGFSSCGPPQTYQKVCTPKNGRPIYPKKVPLRAVIWLWLRKMCQKWHLGKWNQTQKPAQPLAASSLILSHISVKPTQVSYLMLVVLCVKGKPPPVKKLKTGRWRSGALLIAAHMKYGRVVFSSPPKMAQRLSVWLQASC